MTIKTKVRKLGKSSGIALPKETLRTMKVREGDAIYLTDGTNCSMHMTPDTAHAKQMLEIAVRGMRKYRHALRELAK